MPAPSLRKGGSAKNGAPAELNVPAEKVGPLLLDTGWLPYLDLGTAGNDYVTDVLSIAVNCF